MTNVSHAWPEQKKYMQTYSTFIMVTTQKIECNSFIYMYNTAFSWNKVTLLYNEKINTEKMHHFMQNIEN